MKWPQSTCTVVRVLPEVAYIGGWWAVFEVVGGAGVATLFIKISGSFTGVYVNVVTMQDKWNLRCGIRGNAAPNLRTNENSHFLFSNSVMLCFYFVLNTCLSEIACGAWVQSLYFDRPEMKYQKFALQNMSAACEKLMAFCVMLGTACTRTAWSLDVFLELKPRFTPPAVLSF